MINTFDVKAGMTKVDTFFSLSEYLQIKNCKK